MGKSNKVICDKDNYFALLALFISPWKSKDDINMLREMLSSREICWEGVLFQANKHLCTPLWYVSLKRDGLLEILPEDLQEFILNMHALNLERNMKFLAAIKEIHEAFTANDIPFILLKGAAALCDNLYADTGARMLKDIDLLVKTPNAKKASDILEKLGYEQIVDPAMDFEGLPTDKRHHHLYPMAKEGSPVLVEIHYRLSYGASGEVLSQEELWGNTDEINFENQKFLVLNPQCRLLHNAVHALNSDVIFISGGIFLQQFADLIFISKRYANLISWQAWLERGVKMKMEVEFLSYLTLANMLSLMPFPDGVKRSYLSKFHSRRICLAGKYSHTHESLKRDRNKEIYACLIRFLLKLFYYYKLIPWVWRNVCYTGGEGSFLGRVKYMLKKSASSRSRKKI